MAVLAILTLLLFLFFFVLQDQASVRKIINFTRLDSGFQLEFFEEDDSDVKIAGEPHAPPDDVRAEAEELGRQKQNGNLERANKLGSLLCGEISKQDGEASFGKDLHEDNGLFLQRRILLTFAACLTIESAISSKIVQKTAINSLYNSMKIKKPSFYHDLTGSSAFSFYFLCARRQTDTEQNIGKTFAMLAGHESEPVVEEFGRALFLRFSDTIRKIIDSLHFE